MALVDVDQNQYEKIELALSLAEEIPEIGMFIGPISLLLFSEKKDPCYKEMKLEWEGYTDTKITEERRNDLKNYLEGIVNEVKEIVKVPKTDSEIKIRRWDALRGNIVEKLPLFQSRKDEPAAPLLTMFSALGHLLIDCYDQLVLLSTSEMNGRADFFETERSDQIKEFNEKLEVEIEKTAHERTEVVRTKLDKHMPNHLNRYLPIVSISDKDFDIITSSLWTCDLIDKERTINTFRGSKCEEEARLAMVTWSKKVKQDSLDNSRKLFLISDLFKPHQGGILIYLFKEGDLGYVENELHGLIAATHDQSSGIKWGDRWSAISGTEGTALGTGKQNTVNIIAGSQFESYAAEVCNNLELNGYNDWFLPSKEELKILFENRDAIGGFVSGELYWSSSQVDKFDAWGQVFEDGFENSVSKSFLGRVRAVRAF